MVYSTIQQKEKQYVPQRTPFVKHWTNWGGDVGFGLGDIRYTDDCFVTSKRTLREMMLTFNRRFDTPNVLLEPYSPDEVNIIMEKMTTFENSFLQNTVDSNNTKIVRELVSDCRTSTRKKELMKNDYLVCAILVSICELIKV